MTFTTTTTQTIKSDAVNDTLTDVYNEDTSIKIAASTLLANDVKGYQLVTTSSIYSLFLPYTEKINIANLSIVSVQGATNGTVSLSNGIITFTPNANYNGPAQFTYTVSDGKGFTDTASVNLSISPVNDAPDAQNDNLTSTAGKPIVIAFDTLLANDKDVDGDALTIVSVQNAQNGTVAIVNNNVVFTPNAGYSGPAQFEYTISDKGARTTLASFDAEKYAVSQSAFVNGISPGWWSSNPGSVVEVNKSSAYGIPGPDRNVVELERNPGDTANLVGDVATTVGKPIYISFDYSARAGFTESSAINVLINGKLIGTANTKSVGFTRIEFTAIPDSTWSHIEFKAAENNSTGGLIDDIKIESSSSAPLKDTATVNLTINPTTPSNTAPDAVNDSATGSADKALIIAASTLLANDTDANKDNLTITSVQGATNGTVSLNGTNITFTPTAGYSGPASFTYTISDGKGGTDTATVNLTINPTVPVNTAPDAVNDSATGSADKALIIAASTLLANDTDANKDTLSITSVQGATNGTVSLNGTNITFTPTAGYSGPASFTYTISDGKGGTDRATVNLTINPTVPVNTAPDAQDDSTSVEANTSLVILPAANLLANDKDANGDTITITSVQNATNGTVSLVGDNVQFTPTAGYSGPASFTYTISDGKGGTDTATVNLTINPTTPVNTAPDAKDDTITGTAGTQIKISPATLLGNDVDANGDALQGVGLGNAVNGEVAYIDGNVVFLPTAGYTGPASFTYTITDGKGGYDTATVNLTIVADPNANIGPDAKDDAVVGKMDTQIKISPATLLGNDVDANGDALQGVGLGNAVNGEVGFIDGNVVFLPTAGYTGPASFTYTITDGKGGFDTATVNLTIVADTETNIAPDAQNDTASGSQDNAIIISSATLLANDVDANSDSLTITSVQAATNGTVSLNGGNITFTPIAGYNGPASFTYTVSDGKGGTDTATVNLTIAATTTVNAAPDAINDTITGETAGAVLIDPATILANDTDANGDKLEILDLKNAVNGSVGYENGKIVFTPTAGYSGPASFEYVVQDGKGGFDTATVNLTITAVAVLSAVNDQIDAAKSGDLLISPSTLLGNDSGDNINIVDLNNAQNGTVSFDGTNIVFTPAAGYNGPASFNYVIQDAQGNQESATVSLTVYAAVGTAENDTMTGSTGNDTLYSLDGDDTVNGATGNDEIDGGAGADTLNGQAGNDTIAGNLGDDTISGGAGNDSLFGGVGNDTFVWTLSDTTAAGVEVDTVNDFSAGDKLNLKDLLQGESYTPEALDNYLHFDYANGNTTVSISTSGSFTDNTMTGGTPAGTIDQQIVLVGLDLTAGLTNSNQQAIQSLLDNNALVI